MDGFNEDLAHLDIPDTIIRSDDLGLKIYDDEFDSTMITQTKCIIFNA